ncbi:hypothetical protein BaRGS_00008292 [Batillaria attramentaria]|uniref:Uncharacterized protein n=1 Tax=Batillaria attramentaria TaxID=370345 RepID=A0ABD0LM42_9CAEN
MTPVFRNETEPGAFAHFILHPVGPQLDHPDLPTTCACRPAGDTAGIWLTPWALDWHPGDGNNTSPATRGPGGSRRTCCKHYGTQPQCVRSRHYCWGDAGTTYCSRRAEKGTSS